MKKIKFGLFALILLMTSSTFLFISCEDDNKKKDADKIELLAAITAANTLIDGTTEGFVVGNYLPGSQAVFQATVDAAQLVYDDADATQTEVDNTVIAIAAATTAYGLNIVAPIAPGALVGHWTFDEGSGTTLTDFSGNSFDGTLVDGSATWLGGLPTWTTDRYGNAGGALMFDEGAHVVIPENTALNPPSMSISVWVNAAEILENNRFIGLHSWVGYKFQLQSLNRAFFSINTSDGGYDKESETPDLAIDTWYHLVVTFGGGHTIFYVNGTATNDWPTTGTALPNTGNDLVFGQGSDVYAATDANYDVDKIIPLAWGGYFHGAMDEVRIYNTVLTAAQALTIYNLEKVPTK